MATIKVSRDYPLKFNNDVMYYPGSFEVDEDVVENVNLTEAGTDQVQLVRTGKVVLNFATRCLAEWLAKYKSYSALASFTVSYYDVSVNGYVTKTVRMRNFKYTLVKHSYDLEDIMGVYDVSFVLKEF